MNYNVYKHQEQISENAGLHCGRAQISESSLVSEQYIRYDIMHALPVRHSPFFRRFCPHVSYDDPCMITPKSWEPCNLN